MSKWPADKVVRKPLDELVPYANNSRKHSDAQVAQIAASMKEWGWTNPILIDEDGGVIAGHGRLLAARQLGYKDAPCMIAKGWSESQKKAYVIADNKLALNADWDNDLLNLELKGLFDVEFNVELTGFDNDELKDLLFEDFESNESENPYSQKIDAPIYQITGEKPNIEELYNESKAISLIEAINDSTLPKKEKLFLIAAASRHIEFNFEKIAEYYAHSDKECQELMEENALVIIDFDKAIAEGYVQLNKKLEDIFDAENYDE